MKKNDTPKNYCGFFLLVNVYDCFYKIFGVILCQSKIILYLCNNFKYDTT
jgi:hypothetical protein